MAARSGLAEGKGGEMPAGGDLVEDRRDGRTRTSRGNCRGGAHMHQVDHRDRRIRFGKHGRDRRETARPERRSADIGGQRQSEEPRGTQGRDRLR
jgi:hypothetical protein